MYPSLGNFKKISSNLRNFAEELLEAQTAQRKAREHNLGGDMAEVSCQLQDKGLGEKSNRVFISTKARRSYEGTQAGSVVSDSARIQGVL